MNAYTITYTVNGPEVGARLTAENVNAPRSVVCVLAPDLISAYAKLDEYAKKAKDFERVQIISVRRLKDVIM